MPHNLTVECSAFPLTYKGWPTLVPLRLKGREGINSLFEYELLLETTEEDHCLAHYEPRLDQISLLGRALTCHIEIDGPSAGYLLPATRQISGLIASVTICARPGNRRRQFLLTLRPWLHHACLAVDCRVFQKKSVTDILGTVLGAYSGDVVWKLDMSFPAYPERDFQVQYNESDFAFFERLCQEWGINYHFEHGEGRHELVLVDRNYRYRPYSPAYSDIALRTPAWKGQTDYLDSFDASLHLSSRTYTARDFDYSRMLSGPVPYLDSTTNSTGRTDLPVSGAVHEWHGGALPTHYAQPKTWSSIAQNGQLEADFFSSLRLEALHTARHRARAAGNARAMVPGCTFRLREHWHEPLNVVYIVIDTELLIEDTAQESVRDSATTAASCWKTRVVLTAHDMRQALRPVGTRPKPFTHGPQTALVIGDKSAEVWTDGQGRIKVRFLWDRSEEGHRTDSCWVRVATPSAGSSRGMVAIPRVDDEVLIDFIGGDPDLPICTGSLHNSLREAAWLMPRQAVLSGMRSRELGTNGYSRRSNHMLLDDSRGGLQAQLHSDHLHSHLSLGHITRIEGGQGRKESRGQGAELRTDGHGAVRAALGLVLSTHGRKAAAGGITELQETRALLARALEQLDAQASAALALQAQDEGDQIAVAGRIRKQNAAITGASSKPLGELDEPHLVLASSAGVAVAATLGVHLAAGDDIALTSQAHTSIGTGGSFLASAARAVRLLAHQGMRLFAARGDLELQAQNDKLRLTARKAIELNSTDDWVTLQAREGIRLSVGGTCLEVTAAGIELITPGAITAHSAGLSQTGPKSSATHINELPSAEFDDRYFVADGQRHAVAKKAWDVVRAGGTVPGGKSAADGGIDHQRSSGPDGLHLEL